MKRYLSLSLVGLMILSAVVGFFCGGCESDGTVSLTVEPGYIDLTEGTTGETQTFTVTGGLRSLSMPLEWSVSKPELGRIATSGGTSASYIRTGGHGDNSIFVKDQYGAEGVATVTQ